MENNNKLLSMAIVFVLAMAVASNGSSGSKLRDLVEAAKEDRNSSELVKADPSSLPLSPPIIKSSETGQIQSSPPISVHSPPNSKNSDSDNKSPHLSDNSAKVSPPPDITNLATSKQQEDKAPQSPLEKDDDKSQGNHENETEKPLQSPTKDTDKQDGKVPIKAPEKNEEKSPQPSKDGTGSKENEGTSKSGDINEKNLGMCNLTDASNSACRNGALVACLLQSEAKSVELSFLVQNTGPNDLKVNLTVVPNNIKVGSNILNLPKHTTQKINYTADSLRSLKITLNAGEGDCILQTRPTISDLLPFQQFPAYAAQVKPVHGIYLLFLTVTLAGGTWACCKLGKKRRKIDGGMPYQQLEMATQAQSASVDANAVTVDRWDWDDDWDEEEAVRPSGKHPAGNVSSNGLSSRSGSCGKDGWEIDWDD